MYDLTRLISWCRNNEVATTEGGDALFIAGNNRLWGETADALEDLKKIQDKPQPPRGAEITGAQIRSMIGQSDDSR